MRQAACQCGCTACGHAVERFRAIVTAEPPTAVALTSATAQVLRAAVFPIRAAVEGCRAELSNMARQKSAKRRESFCKRIQSN